MRRSLCTGKHRLPHRHQLTLDLPDQRLLLELAHSLRNASVDEVPRKKKNINSHRRLNQTYHTFFLDIHVLYHMKKKHIALSKEVYIEVKLPTVWTNRQQRWEESEKRREEKRRKKIRDGKSQRKKKRRGRSRCATRQESFETVYFSIDVWLLRVKK